MDLVARGEIRGRPSEKAVAARAVAVRPIVEHLQDRKAPEVSVPIVEPDGVDAVGVAGGDARGDEGHLRGRGGRADLTPGVGRRARLPSG